MEKQTIRGDQLLLSLNVLECCAWLKVHGWWSADGASLHQQPRVVHDTYGYDARAVVQTVRRILAEEYTRSAREVLLAGVYEVYPKGFMVLHQFVKAHSAILADHCFDIGAVVDAGFWTFSYRPSERHFVEHLLSAIASSQVTEEVLKEPAEEKTVNTA